jgi:putative ABC transport system permease protein
LPGADRVYQLQSKLVMGPSREETLLQMAPLPAGPALKKDFPQIDKVLHLEFGPSVVMHKGEARDAEGVLLVDGPFFDVLPLPLVRGNPKTALAQVGSLVLTESEARKYFGSEDPVGQVLTAKSGETNSDYRVTGVLRDLPKNSHLDFKMLARADLAATSGGANAWNSFGGFTYLTLKPGADPEAIHAGMPAWKKRNIPNPSREERVLDDKAGGSSTSRPSIWERLKADWPRTSSVASSSPSR